MRAAQLSHVRRQTGGTMQTPRWPEQRERVQRALARVQQLGVSSAPPVNVDADLDEIYAFFLFCFHFRDWLKADPTVPRDIKDQVDPTVKNSEILSLCADIANANKHLKHSRRRWGVAKPGDMQAEITRNWARLRDTNELQRLPDQATYYVEVGAERWVVRVVAESAVREWDSFLRSVGLL